MLLLLLLLILTVLACKCGDKVIRVTDIIVNTTTNTDAEATEFFIIIYLTLSNPHVNATLVMSFLVFHGSFNPPVSVYGRSVRLLSLYILFV